MGIIARKLEICTMDETEKKSKANDRTVESSVIYHTLFTWRYHFLAVRCYSEDQNMNTENLFANRLVGAQKGHRCPD